MSEPSDTRYGPVPDGGHIGPAMCCHPRCFRKPAFYIEQDVDVGYGAMRLIWWYCPDHIYAPDGGEYIELPAVT